MQHALYRAAKADPGRRFHALYDKVSRSDVLWRAWAAVRRNNGAPGIDKITLAAVEEYGIDRLLGELASELREGRYRPLPARRVYIPKPGSLAGEQRPLSIPPVRDRIVQAAVKIVLEPVFEADFLPVSFGFRPKRSAHDALQVLIDECWRGRRWVVETDIANCLDPWSYCSFADFRVQKRPSWVAGISIRRPFLRPVRVRTARSSPRLTFCNTVCRETPSAWVA
ncbi:MAG: reverse transcriptase domain-containing protein [Streptosporangiaceae bacterium]